MSATLWPKDETPDQVQSLVRRLDKAVNGATAATHPKSLSFLVMQLEAMADFQCRGIREQFPRDLHPRKSIRDRIASRRTHY